MTTWAWPGPRVRQRSTSAQRGGISATAPGPDIAAYHDRQIVTFASERDVDWLTLAKPQGELLRALPGGRLSVETLHKDGVAQDAPVQGTLL